MVNSGIVTRIATVLKSKTFKNGTLFTVFAFANNAISFILLIVLARYIDPGEYGQLNLFSTFTQLFGYIICLSTTGYIEVSFFKKTKGQLRDIINAVFLISFGMLFLLSAFLLFFSGPCHKIVGIEVQYQWLALFICFFYVFNNVNLEIWRLEEKPMSYGLYSISSCVLNFIITLVLVICFQKGWLGRLYAQVVIAVLYFIISVVFLFKRRYVSLMIPSINDFKETLHFGVPLIPHQVAYWIRQGCDRFVINYYLSSSYVGLYGFASSFANILTIIGGAFNATNSVYIFKNLANGYTTNKVKLRKLTIVMTLFFLLCAIVIISGCYLIIPLLMPKYVDSLPYLIPLSLTSLFVCLYLLHVNYLFYYCKTKQLMYITTAASVGQLITSVIFTRYGALWTAYISACYSFVIFISVNIYSKKILKEIEANEIKNREGEPTQ